MTALLDYKEMNAITEDGKKYIWVKLIDDDNNTITEDDIPNILGFPKFNYDIKFYPGSIVYVISENKTYVHSVSGDTPWQEADSLIDIILSTRY